MLSFHLCAQHISAFLGIEIRGGDQEVSVYIQSPCPDGGVMLMLSHHFIFYSSNLLSLEVYKLSNDESFVFIS